MLKETGKPVFASLCITSESDFNGVPTEECAARLVKAGKNCVVLTMIARISFVAVCMRVDES